MRNTVVVLISTSLLLTTIVPLAMADEADCQETVFQGIDAVDPLEFEETWQTFMEACNDSIDEMVTALETLELEFENAMDDTDALFASLTETEDEGSETPTTLDGPGTWKLIPSLSVNSPMDAEQVDECLDDSDDSDSDDSPCEIIRKCGQNTDPRECRDQIEKFIIVSDLCEPVSGHWICPIQEDAGRIFEETSWWLEQDNPAEPPKEDAKRDGVKWGLTCAAATAIGGPAAGGACAAAGGIDMGDKALNGDYSGKDGDGFYRVKWTEFGWTDPVLENPTDSSMSSEELEEEPEVDIPFKGADEKTYAANKRTAQQKTQEAAKTFNALVGDASSSVTFKVALGLLHLHVTASGTGVVTIEGDSGVFLEFFGEAQVQELSILGFVEWELLFEGEGSGKTINTVDLDI